MILNGECGVFSPKLLECLKNVQDEFTRLTREYSDHGGEKTVFEPKQPRLSFQKEDTAAMAQYKYFTLLRYMGCYCGGNGLCPGTVSCGLFG